MPIFNVLLIAGTLLAVFAQEQENSCVTCHKAGEGTSYFEHNFADWEKSVHAKAGVSCQVCHGGQELEKEKQAAHKGMLPSTNKNSGVYFTKIPKTCGQCHASEFASFKKSKHYRELENSGRGPNCVTCHGSMANHILSPRELEMPCTLCHRRPTQAYAALMALNHPTLSLSRLEKSLDLARQQNIRTIEQGKGYQKAVELHARIMDYWHTFNMKEVLRLAQEITRQVTNSLLELQLKGLIQDASQPKA